MTTLAGACATATGLAARTRGFEVPGGRRPDLLAAAGHDGRLWWRDGGGLAGVGEALRIRLPDGLADAGGVRAAGAALAAVTADDEVRLPGTGAVGLGALPFGRQAPAELVVPAALVGWNGRQAWVTTVSPAGDTGRAEALARVAVAAALGRAPAEDSPPAPDEFRLSPARPHAEWQALVADTVRRIRAGELAKVVLARRVDVTANRDLPTSEIVERLIALYPSCMVFRMGVSRRGGLGAGAFLGASPELLVSRRGEAVASHPLAGTVARSGDAAADRTLVEGLRASVKERAEHAFVVDALRDRLGPLCEELTIPDVPSVLELRNVSHLETRITGRLRAGRERPTALQLAAATHPTPAVGGTPNAAACAYLAEVEGFDRGPYAGAVGWVDAAGDGDWAVGIRSATVDGQRASLFAGVGVVADSDPAAELAETQLKLQALLAAVVRP